MSTTLITGATGYVGQAIAARLLAATDDTLVCTARSAAQRDLLLERLGPPAARRVAVVQADLAEEGCLDAVDAGSVTHIVHAAAVTRFGVERELARRTNLDGTARVCDLAIRCSNLERFVMLSTLYSAGRRQGAVREEPHDEAPFANHYEWSKWAAERHALKTCGELALSVLRLPTVIADDATGKVSQYNAFHNTAKLFHYGLMPIVPGDPATPVSVGSAAFVTDAIAHLLLASSPPGIYHLCAGPEQTMTWGALVDQVFAVLQDDPGFRRRRVLRPLSCDEATFDEMLAAAGAMRGGPIHQGLASVAPFVSQLFLPKVFHNDALRAAWPGYWADDPASLVERVCHHLVRTRWGRVR